MEMQMNTVYDFEFYSDCGREYKRLQKNLAATAWLYQEAGKKFGLPDCRHRGLQIFDYRTWPSEAVLIQDELVKAWIIKHFYSLKMHEAFPNLSLEQIDSYTSHPSIIVKNLTRSDASLYV